MAGGQADWGQLHTENQKIIEQNKWNTKLTWAILVISFLTLIVGLLTLLFK